MTSWLRKKITNTYGCFWKIFLESVDAGRFEINLENVGPLMLPTVRAKLILQNLPHAGVRFRVFFLQQNKTCRKDSAGRRFGSHNVDLNKGFGGRQKSSIGTPKFRALEQLTAERTQKQDNSFPIVFRDIIFDEEKLIAVFGLAVLVGISMAFSSENLLGSGGSSRKAALFF